MMRAVHSHFGGLFRLIAALLFALAASPAFAQPVDNAELDQLFELLKAAPDAESAHAIDQRIWLRWTTPTDPALASRMREVFRARTEGDYVEGIALLSQLVKDYPDYAEGWNQRATLFYMIGDFESSIADCEKVLALEPRHFGALSGRAMMYLQQGKRGLALKDMKAALDVHPFLNERQLFPELQREQTRI